MKKMAQTEKSRELYSPRRELTVRKPTDPNVRHQEHGRDWHAPGARAGNPWGAAHPRGRSRRRRPPASSSSPTSPPGTASRRCRRGRGPSGQAASSSPAPPGAQERRQRLPSQGGAVLVTTKQGSCPLSPRSKGFNPIARLSKTFCE